MYGMMDRSSDMMRENVKNNMMGGNIMNNMMNDNMMGGNMMYKNMMGRNMMNENMMGQEMSFNVMGNRMNTYSNDNSLPLGQRNSMSQRMQIEQIPQSLASNRFF